MSEMEKHEELSRFDSMSTEELQEILRKHAHGELEIEPDTQELYKIMEVLSVRRQENDSQAFQTDEEAYVEFCQHYKPEEQAADMPKGILFPSRWYKAVAAVLALVLILAAATSITAEALHIDIWNRLASWTNDVFQFGQILQVPSAPDPELEYNAELQSLQDALNRLEITEKLAPTWMPAGYISKDLKITSTPRVRNIGAIYEKNGSELIIKICQTIGVPAAQVEKNDDLLEVYVVDGVEYYIFSNTETLQATWAFGEFECIIIGQITLEEMKTMIDSI